MSFICFYYFGFILLIFFSSVRNDNQNLFLRGQDCLGLEHYSVDSVGSLGEKLFSRCGITIEKHKFCPK